MEKLRRILIADSDIEFAKAFRKFIRQQPDFTIAEIVRDGQGAVNVSKIVLPDLVLIDLHLPVLDSIKAIQAILANNERIKILAISTVAADRYAIEAIKAGATGYIEKDGPESFATIVQALHQVSKGESPLNPALAISILQEFDRLTEYE